VVISRQRLLRFEPETPNVELEGITAGGWTSQGFASTAQKASNKLLQEPGLRP
jgi:hypothetical protein